MHLSFPNNFGAGPFFDFFRGTSNTGSSLTCFISFGALSKGGLFLPKKLKLGVKAPPPPGWDDEFGDRQLTPLLVEVVEFELERQPGGDDAPELESL